MMSAIMPVSHTHRFSWRSWKPLIALSLLAMISLGTLAPLAAFADHEPGHVGASTEPEAPAIDPSTAPDPPALSTADQTLCSPDFAGSGFAAARCVFFNVIAEILLLIASLLGRILVFMVDILIAFASYNDFGGTVVVARGWVIVRDICNMFFIVVLLVSAFATIIGYDEGNFHYKRVLPKLLLMAVLINFSRTLILLLVDFSQVIMLTFVNAFAQAGPGNLVSALKMEQVLKLAPTNAGAGTDAVGTAIANSGIAAGSVDPMNLILAIMLAIFMLSISLGVVIIMTAYLIFRIVGLWLALILSPIALFATALPGRLQKGLDSFTGKYWQRLSAMIVGGPVMAFFLWLTFAITQNSVGEGGLAPALKFNVSNPTVTFLTTIGNSQDIASFIIGITLMLMGLDAAVQVSGQVSDTLGGFAKKTASASKALGSLAATAPFLGAYYGGRGAARYIDRRADISGRAATAAAATVGQIPILRSFIRKPLSSAMTRNKRLDLEETKEYQAGLENMTPAQRAIMASATPASIIATKGQRAAYAQQQMERAAPKNAQAIKDELMPGIISNYTANSDLAKHQADLKAAQASGDQAAIQAATGKVTDEKRKIESRAAQDADREVTKRQSELLGKAMTAAKGMGDEDMVRKIEEEYKKNPQLNANKMEMAKALLADKKALNGMSDQAKGDVSTLMAIMEESGAVQKDKAGNVTGFDRAKMEGLKDKVTDKGLRENMEMVEKYVNGQKDPTGKQMPVAKAFFDQASIGKNAKGKTRMFQKGAMGEVSSAQEKAARDSFAANKTAVGPTGIMDEKAVESMLRLGDAEEALGHQPAWGAYAPGAFTDMSSLNDWDYHIEKEVVMENGAPKVDKSGQTVTRDVVSNNKTRDQVASALKKVELLMAKADDMSTPRRKEFMSKAVDNGVIKILINGKKSGHIAGSKSASYHKVMKDLVSFETEFKRSGRTADPNDQKILSALSELRAELEKPENTSVGSTYRKTVEPEE